MYKSTQPPPFKKYVPSDPTSPHWYSAESLKVLVFNHIAHARNGGRDLPLGTFVRQFQGLTRTSKAKAVCAHLAPLGNKHLSDFERNRPAVAQLLRAMQAEAKPPSPAALGRVGEPHFKHFFTRTYPEVREFRYAHSTGTLPSGLPITFEFAVATLGSPGHLYTAINYSPTFGDPLEGWWVGGPAFKANGIQGFLREGHALPHCEEAGRFYEPASVAVAAHIITPAPMFLDRGKTRLDMRGS